MGERPGRIGKGGDAFCGGQVGDMHDQGIVAGPSLGGIDRSHGHVIGGVGGQPVDRFRRQRDKPALPEQGRGAGMACGGIGQDFGCGHGSDVTLRLIRAGMRP